MGFVLAVTVVAVYLQGWIDCNYLAWSVKTARLNTHFAHLIISCLCTYVLNDIITSYKDFGQL